MSQTIYTRRKYRLLHRQGAQAVVCKVQTANEAVAFGAKILDGTVVMRSAPKMAKASKKSSE